MREAMGGALLIKLVMFFIIIYVCFFSVAINYSVTFRVKNQIINLIESYESYDLAKDKIESYIANVGYYRSVGTMTVGEDCVNASSSGGYCIKKNTIIKDGVEVGEYYRVTTYVSFDFPIFGEITNFPVSGETRVLYKL